MRITYNKFLIAFTVIIIFGGIYVYSSKGLNASADTQVSPDSSLSSSLGSTSSGSVDDQIAQDTAFLATLASLKTIHIDTTLFSNQSFESLKDNTVKLSSVAPGRINPFANIDTLMLNNSSVTVLPVVTNQPTQITDKAAVLSGLVNSTSGVSSTYFEYGTSESLGKTTTPVKQSLIGTFVTSITGLSSQTNYFFRAVAKINGNIVNGEIVSFTTN